MSATSNGAMFTSWRSLKTASELSESHEGHPAPASLAEFGAVLVMETGGKESTGLRYTEAMPGKVGRPVDRSLRDQIRELLRSGTPQAEIARILDKAPSTIAHHVRALGRKAKEYESPAPVGKDGKRRCVQCGKRKSLGAFPNERNASCSMCVRGLSD